MRCSKTLWFIFSSEYQISKDRLLTPRANREACHGYPVWQTPRSPITYRMFKNRSIFDTFGPKIVKSWLVFNHLNAMSLPTSSTFLFSNIFVAHVFFLVCLWLFPSGGGLIFCAGPARICGRSRAILLLSLLKVLLFLLSFLCHSYLHLSVPLFIPWPLQLILQAVVQIHHRRLLVVPWGSLLLQRSL